MSHPRPLQCPVIVGRDDLLNRIDHLVGEARLGRGHALFLSGQAGLGKTRLIRAAAHKAELAGLRVNGGSVAPQDRQVPLASIREMAVGMRGDAAFGELSADLLAIDGRHAGDALGSRRLIVRSAAERILAAIDRPTMLVFDDLHWADELSLELVGQLARYAAEHPLLLLAGYRADEFPPDTIHREWRARLLAQRHAEEARLRPLTVEETATATSLILGRGLPAPRDVVDAIHERTNGIPLHVEELIAALDDEALADGRRIREAHVPDTIGDAVLARLARLSSDARLLARAGAVVGRCFSPDAIAGILDRPLAELEPALEELVEASMLYPFQYIDQGYYDFRHQLLRDAVYSSVPPAQLRRFHAQAAEFVMTLEAASIIHASRHYERAGLRLQAFRSALEAATEASRISARQEAYELYRRAIDNMPADLPPTEQADLFGAYAAAASAIEWNEDCVEAATRARELYQAAGKPLAAAEMLLLTSVTAARGAESHEALHRFLAQGLAEVERVPAGPERERVRAVFLSMSANYRLFASDHDAADDRETVLEADLVLARVDIAAGRWEEGLRDGMRAAREARDAGFESVGVTGYRNLAVMAARLMDHDAAETAIGEGLQYADAIEQSHCRQMMATTRAILDWAAGDWDTADALARQELVDRGCRRGAIGALDVIGLVALGRGELDEARRWLDDSLSTARQIGEAQLLLTPLWARAETDLVAGDPDAALARCDEGLALSERTSERALLVPFVVTAVRALLALRRPDDAERWLARARAALHGWDAVAGPALDHAEGLLRLAAGSPGSARELLERAVTGWQERRRIWEASWARLDLAQTLLRANRHADAAAVLAEVRAAAAALRAAVLAERAEALARAARGRGLEDEPWRPLTVREFEVARHIAGGLTNAQIAESLVVSPRTVSAHVEHILAKLGVDRRAEVAAWVARIAPAAAGNGASGQVATWPGAAGAPPVELARARAGRRCGAGGMIGGAKRGLRCRGTTPAGSSWRTSRSGWGPRSRRGGRRTAAGRTGCRPTRT